MIDRDGHGSAGNLPAMVPFGEEAVLSEMSIRDGVFERLHRRVFYGWVILAVAGLGIFVSGPGQ